MTERVHLKNDNSKILKIFFAFCLEVKREKLATGIVLLVTILLLINTHLFNPWSDFERFERFGGNDPWYYYRLIDSCVKNFPEKLWFDAFTYYPYGTYVHFGPFLVYLGAILVKIFRNAIVILSVIPVFGAIITVFSVYLIAKETFGTGEAILAALLISIMPGQFLGRSILGFNDHHIWEVVWMTITLGMYLYSINRDKLGNYVLPGVAYGMYILTWAPGSLFGVFILAYIILLLFLRWWIEFDEKVIKGTILMFLIAALVYLPFSDKVPEIGIMFHSRFHLYMIIAMSGFLILLYMVEVFLKRGFYEKLTKNVKSAYYFTISLVCILSAVLLNFIYPQVLTSVYSVLGIVTPKGGALTVAEIQPFFTLGGQFTLAPAYGNFGVVFFFVILAYPYLIFKIFKERDHAKLLLFLWSIVMFIFLAEQNRFAYYFAAVAAVLGSCFLVLILRKLEFDKFILKLVRGEIKKTDVKYFRVFLSVFLIFVVVYPTYGLALSQSKYVGGINSQWYEALTWMRNNTPNKEFFDNYYYEIYEYPKQSKQQSRYDYPPGTYAVMSWWDYGHWIEVIAHRMPNANPFQEGIGNKVSKAPGAAPFFTAFSEEEANQIANRLGINYVVSDVEMATGKFYAMAVWAENSLDKAWSVYYAGRGYFFVTPDGRVGVTSNKYFIPAGSKILELTLPSENYYRTMEARFHIFDGCGLKHYRMVYESDPETKGNVLTIEAVYRAIYNAVYMKKLGLPAVNITSTGYVKIFEFVRGAKVIGKVGKNISVVTVNATVTTNKGRSFEYVQKVKVGQDGTFELVLPYAQKTIYPVKPSPYYVKAGNVTKTLVLTDEDVEKGKTIELDLI